MNTLQYINTMGTKQMSDLESKTLDRFIELNQSLSPIMTRKQIYHRYKNTFQFTSIRMSVAVSVFSSAFRKVTTK